MDSPQAVAVAPKKSRWWLWVLLGCGCLTLAVGGVCGGCMWWGYRFANSVIKMTQEIEALARNNPHVRDEIGDIRKVEPVQDPGAQAKDMGSIPMKFQVTGTKGTRMVHAVVSMSFTSFELKSVRLEREDGSFIDLK